MYFDLFKIPRVMLYILKITGKRLPVANLRRGFESVSCHTHNIYVQQTFSKTRGPAAQIQMVFKSLSANVHPAASR